MQMAETLTKSQLDYVLSFEPYLADRINLPAEEDNAPFLELLFSAGRDYVSQSFTERHCAPGEVVFCENETGDTMYIVVSGRIAIVKGDLDAPTVIDFRGAGEIFGEMALLEDQPRSATIIAIDDLHLLTINRQNFRDLLEKMPSVSFRIMRTLSARLRRSDEVLQSGDRSEKRLISQVSLLQNEKQRLEELQRLRQETSDLIIHDLRNPLTAIAISLKMFSIVIPPEVLEAHRQLLEVGQSSVERMQRLVDSLLEVSRMEAGETEFLMAEIDLRPTIVEITRRISVMDRKNIDIQVHVPADLPRVRADRDKIDRVITNLLDNALKYTSEGGRITFAAEVQGDFVCVSVSDDGPGIPPEQRERVFERFAQIDSEKRARRGFGLGLAYCRLAVERHGGRIWVEAGEGGIGSSFRFTLPVATL